MENVKKSHKRVDAYQKVTGQAKYGADYFLEGMLYGAVKRSEISYGLIKKINTEKAQMLKGVKAIVTADDVTGEVGFGLVIPNLCVLANKKVMFKGEAICAVAAESEKIARAAVDLIEVEYEELTGVFDVFTAIKENAPQLHLDAPNNIVNHHPLRKGNIEEGFGLADHIIEKSYSTPFIEHAYLETEAAVALIEDGTHRLTVYGSIQNPFATRKDLARILNLPLNQVRVVQSFMGGSFGGKDQIMSQIAARAALLAFKTKRPVKMVHTREESFLESYKRHPYQMTYRVGAKKNGKITAMEIKMYADSGAYCCMTPFVTWRSTVQCTGPYQIPHVKADIYGVYTNNVTTGAMRGFGSPQPIFAQESLMDELAQELNIDPIEIRLINGFEQGSITATNQTLDSHQVSLKQVINEVVKATSFQEKWARYQKQAGDIRKGIGIACSFRGCSLGAEGVDATGAIVSVQEDGTVYVAAGLAENGMGLNTVFSQIAAEELGISLDRVVFLESDTSLIPDGGPTVASRSTLMGGNAVRLAGAKVKETLLQGAAVLLKAAQTDLVAAKDKIFVKDNPQQYITFQEAVDQARSEGELLAAYGWYKAPKVSWDEEKGQGRAYFTYVYAAQVAEIEIDLATGKIKVEKVTAAHDVGCAINPESVRGQIIGGVAMAMGYGILEELEIYQGDMKTVNFDEYLIPGAKDVPEVIPIIIENPDDFGPYGAKSIGEPTNELCQAAIANALFNGANRRVRELPLNLERVLLGYSLQQQRYNKEGL